MTPERSASCANDQAALPPHHLTLEVGNELHDKVFNR
jgi:hypothetical protein